MYYPSGQESKLNPTRSTMSNNSINLVWPGKHVQRGTHHAHLVPCVPDTVPTHLSVGVPPAFPDLTYRPANSCNQGLFRCKFVANLLAVEIPLVAIKMI